MMYNFSTNIGLLAKLEFKIELVRRAKILTTQRTNRNNAYIHYTGNEPMGRRVYIGS